MVYLSVKTNDKEFMFNLGRIFAKGEQVSILNKEDVNSKIQEEVNLGYAKSFNMMIKYWQDMELAPEIFNQKQNDNKIFLICPVRNATDNEKQILNNIISKYEKAGFKIHYPSRDTNQNPILNGVNTGGYNICLQNARALASSKTVVLYYNPQSVGSMFDLGVAYETMQKDPSKRFILENETALNDADFISNKIKELQHKSLLIDETYNR